MSLDHHFAEPTAIPKQSWRYLRLVGTESFDLVDHVDLAGRGRENVEARRIRREHRCAYWRASI